MPAEGIDRDAMIQKIARTPALRREAMDLVGPVTKAAFAQPADQEIYAALQRLMLVCKMEDFGEGELGKRLEGQFLAQYYAALRDLPIEAIEAGVTAYMKAAQYHRFPMPGELRKFMEPVAVQMRTAAYRLKKALEDDGARAVQPEEKAQVRAMMAERGWLDENGNFDVKRALGSGPTMPVSRRTGETQHQMAERIRRSA